MLYQFRTPESFQDLFGWGMSQLVHFDRDVSVANWTALRERVTRILRSDEELERVIAFVPYQEVGTDFIVQCKPPYDGGYFLNSLHEWLTYGDTCMPPEACESAYAHLQAGIERVIRALPSTDRELHEHVIRLTFTATSESGLQFVEGEGWRLYELAIADEFVDRFLRA